MMAGRIRVNGRLVTEPGSRVDPEKDSVEVDGRIVSLNQKPVYIALNKPAGYVSSCKQRKDKTILDLIDVPHRIYPVGRLDKDSTGLMILTNDGRIHHRLLHPSFDHEKEYEVTVASPITDEAINKMERGVTLKGKKTRPAEITRISPKRFRIVLKEGRNRQVRRMAGKVGATVTRLKRTRFAGVTLAGLGEGEWRYLTEGEKRNVLQSLDDKTGE